MILSADIAQSEESLAKYLEEKSPKIKLLTLNLKKKFIKTSHMRIPSP